MDRRILHIDMDAFFAAVEVVRDPSLRGKPLIIGGTKEDVRGVVSTASYEARAFGVHSAMPISEAKRRCPQGIFMRGDHALYGKVSREVHAILDTVSPLVQMASIDEAYIDVTGSQKLFGGDDAIAAHIKNTIRTQLSLPCTVAISPNKLVSKIGSGEAKPDGYHCIKAGGEAAYLAPLSVRKLPGAGPKTCDRLELLGLFTLGHVAAQPAKTLERAFGEQMGLWLHRAAHGIGSDVISLDHTAKQISRETTFAEDLADWSQLESVLAYLLERCMYTLRESNLEARRITLKVRYSDFETKTFSKTLEEATAIDQVAMDALRTLVPKAQERRARVRLIGVSLGQLVENQHQLKLFSPERDVQWEQVLTKVDAIRGKHGFQSLQTGKSLGQARPKDQRRRD